MINMLILYHHEILPMLLPQAAGRPGGRGAGMKRIDWDGVVAGTLALAILAMVALLVGQLRGIGP